VFGRPNALPVDLAETARRVRSETGNNEGMCLDVALRYAGHDELAAATRGPARSLAAGVAPAQLPRQSRPRDFWFIDVHWPTSREPDLLLAAPTCEQPEGRFGR
jgi:undecaprenyl pyrophosphate synthase